MDVSFQPSSTSISVVFFFLSSFASSSSPPPLLERERVKKISTVNKAILASATLASVQDK